MNIKPIVVELVPIAILGFAWVAIKNMDKHPTKDTRLARFISRIKWEAWMITLVVAMIAAAMITKAAL